jgi:raffinose/stachyose/melibiose transport system permease protein
MNVAGPNQAYRSSSGVKARRFSISFLQYLILSAVLIFTVGPVVLMWSSAFKSNLEINADPIALPKSLNPSNLKTAWTTGRFSSYSVNSVIITLPTVLGVVAFSSLAGYGFARHKFFGKKVFFYLFLLGLMVPFQSIMIPLYFNLKDYGLLGTYFAMIFPAIGLGMPFGIFLMQSFFRGLPSELSDSGRVDGCNEFQVFWHIILPLTTPAISSLAIFQFVWTWNAFLMPLIYLNKEEFRPMTLGLMFFQGRYTSDLGLISAGVTIATLPLVAVYVLLQRQFLRGLTSGAVKG